MSCEKMAQKISMLVDGELAPMEQTLVMEHIEYCSSCAADYQGYLRTESIFRKASPVVSNLSVVDAVLQSTEPALPRYWWWERVAAAILIFIVGGMAGRLSLDIFQDGRKRQNDNIIREAVKPVRTVVEKKVEYPYQVKIPDENVYFVIESKQDELEWQKFLQNYRYNRGLNRYKIDRIPRHFIRYGDF